ncbi:hypothetical protein [Paraliomyxa miuraensis]|uniref:hypothetical protein n=1 Tax=Paraliomyxa miuraensis TaxID=376150 RepID=UPI00224FC922|nr:hypothetical protein [Paraliomyxa miuraensis]MCX4246544.1 hypothetical protein [Paraliomyxa miuraensis]
MIDREHEAIDDSLRRQFAPPSLDGLNDRIAAIAASMGEAEPRDAAQGVDPLPLSSRATSREPPGEDRSRALVLVAFAVAAALVLVFSWPRGGGPATQGTHDSALAVATPSQVAGKQLHDFLRAARYPSPPGDMDCALEQPPSPSCSAAEGTPTLVANLGMQLVWECGGLTGVSCQAHELPAQRLMVVQLLPAGPDVLVCIEPPWADPQPELPDDTDYRIFRRTLGSYVLYEVTPLDEPRVLSHVKI